MHHGRGITVKTKVSGKTPVLTAWVTSETVFTAAMDAAVIFTTMGKKETEVCRQHRADLDRSIKRRDQLVEHGVNAMSVYDIEIAHGGNEEQALQEARRLVGNHISYFSDKVAECDKRPRQTTLFDAHLESDYDERNGDSGE